MSREPIFFASSQCVNLSSDCLCSVALPYGAAGRSAVCNCRISFIFTFWLMTITIVPMLFMLQLYPCCSYLTINEPRYEIPNNMVCATSKGSDQPAHTRSLIRAFASHLNIEHHLELYIYCIYPIHIRFMVPE